jgi:ubiquinone biosynthesis protein
VKLSRAGDVARVLGHLAAGEAARTIGLTSRTAAPVEEDRRGQRARAVRRALEDLGPFYVKVGQILATRPDIVPEYMIEEFEHLHQQVSVAPFSDFEPVLEAELGMDWRNYFDHIDTDKPLGAASLAQVYRVTLKTGEPAVVKIQRPGIASVMLDDMAMVKQVVRFIAKRTPDFNEVIDVEATLEIMFRAMEPELDFTVEAQNMDAARRTIADFEHLGVPEVIFVTKRVMIQSLAPGKSIRDADRDAFSKEERETIGRELLAFLYRGYFIDRFFHADPHPGNIFVEPGGKAYLIDWGMVGRMDRRASMALVLVLVNMAGNDGAGVAKAWIELGRATSVANIPAFMSDLSGFIPTIAGASMEQLNFGVALISVLRFATRRGIQTPPVVGLLGKSFANLEGSVRYLAPELSLIDAFEDEFQDIMFDLVAEVLSNEQAAKAALEVMIGTLAAPEQLRTLVRDVSNREFTLNVNQAHSRRGEERADARAKSLRRTLGALGAVALWLDHRRRTRTAR